MSKPGKLFLLTGANGTGKSTVGKRVAIRLQAQGLKAAYVYSQGTTPASRAFQAVILDDELHPQTHYGLALAYFTVHAEMIAAVRQRVNQGEIIILDRGPESTLIYQIYGNRLEKEHPELVEIYHSLMKDLSADTIIWLDTDSDTAMSRADQQDRSDHQQAVSKQVYEKRRSLYAKLAESSGWERIDATPSIDIVEEALWKIVISTLL